MERTNIKRPWLERKLRILSRCLENQSQIINPDLNYYISKLFRQQVYVVRR